MGLPVKNVYWKELAPFELPFHCLFTKKEIRVEEMDNVFIAHNIEDGSKAVVFWEGQEAVVAQRWLHKVSLRKK